MIQYYYVLALKARTDYMFCAGFFHTRKNLKNFSKEVIKSHLAVLIWCGKRDKHFSNHKGKEVRLMKPSDFQKTVQCRFESCLKKVVRSVVKDYYKELNRRKNKEISFSELPMSLLIKWLFGTTTKQIIQSFQYVALIFVSLMMNWQKP